MPACNFEKIKLPSQQGAAMIELAFVLPVFLLLVLGILYFSIYYYTGQAAQFLAQQAVLSATRVDPAAVNAKQLIQKQVEQRLTQLKKTSPDYIGPFSSDGCDGNALGAHICVDSKPNPQRYHVTVHLVAKFDDIWSGFPDLIEFLTAGSGSQVLITGNASTNVYGRQATP